MREEKVLISSTGIRLEGLLSHNEALSFKGGVIFCHPHPQYGGDMHNTVITTGVEAAWAEGLSTLRFNFRGVGGSEGSYAEGIGEREDVKGVIRYLGSKLKGTDPPLILLGYSFGAWAGLPVAAEEGRMKGLIAIAPPIELYDFTFLKGCRKRKFFVVGDQDPFCPVHLMEDLYRQMEEPKALSIIEGADHFFFTQHHLLIPLLREFFKKFSSSE